MKTQVTKGKQAVRAPRMRPKPDDLPEHILNEKVWLNKDGTFGVASAGYWWASGGLLLPPIALPPRLPVHAVASPVR